MMVDRLRTENLISSFVRRCRVFVMPVVVAVSVSVVASAGSADAQTLDEAFAAAYLNNPDLLAARAGLRSTDEGVPQALANWRPDVSVSADVGASSVFNSASTTDRRQHRDPKSVTLSVTQPLFRGGRTLAATAGAENDVRAARARLLTTEQTVLLATATAYMDVYRDQAVLDLNINNERVLQRQLEATRDRFSVGEITRTDVNQAEARLATAVADRIQSEGDLEVSRAAYKKVVGEAIISKLQLPASPAIEPTSVEDAARIAVRKNPDVIAAEFDRKAALDNVDEVWGELLPEVDVSASVSRSLQSSGESGRNDTAEITLNLSVPLYQKGSVYSRLRQSRQQAAQQVRLIDSQRRTAIEAATAAWENVATAGARVQSLRTSIEASVVALEGVEREAAVGSRTVLDVLDAEQELLNSRVAHVRGQRDESVAIYQLLSAIGKLTARGLNLPVEMYDPTANYKQVREKWFGGRSQGGVE